MRRHRQSGGTEMTQDDIIRMALEAGFNEFSDGLRDDGSRDTYLDCWPENLERFAALVAAAEREKLAHWMRSMGYATGHGDTIEERLHQINQSHEMKLSVRGHEIQIADLKAVNAELLDAMISFTKSAYIKKHHPKRYAAAIAAIAKAEEQK
jgi:hypothetical protein